MDAANARLSKISLEERRIGQSLGGLEGKKLGFSTACGKEEADC